ncbi:cytochrome b [Martelella alba]|uniref:Cytochrome b n=2 Tax=Martelella alba TaxID=2590451 RepID=A0ABY2SM67_9HYPH|nr:cytochrome b [Martelella alba]
MSHHSLSPANALSPRYDKITLTLHWATAFIVIFLFLIAQIWDFFPHGSYWRMALQSLHISFGIALAAVILLRILWRATAGRHLPPPTTTSALLNNLARMTHWALYVLVVAQVALGFLLRWAQGEPFTFFGLLNVPDIFGVDPFMRRTFANLHAFTAWVVILLAGLHACAALYHHYVLRDDTLRRMMPPAK